MGGLSKARLHTPRRNIMAGAYPHAKNEKVYYVRLYGYSFVIKKLDANGKPIQRTNQATGLPIYGQNGEPEFIEQTIDFDKWKTRFTQDGYVSVYVVKPTTSKLISDELEKAANDRGNEIMSESEFIKSVNPELYEQMEKDRQIETTLGEKDQKINSLLDEVAKLRSKLGGGDRR
jgi:hypothetical protein